MIRQLIYIVLGALAWSIADRIVCVTLSIPIPTGWRWMVRDWLPMTYGIFIAYILGGKNG